VGNLSQAKDGHGGLLRVWGFPPMRQKEGAKTKAPKRRRMDGARGENPRWMGGQFEMEVRAGLKCLLGNRGALGRNPSPLRGSGIHMWECSQGFVCRPQKRTTNSALGYFRGIPAGCVLRPAARSFLPIELVS
jgi:hypothetical protein